MKVKIDQSFIALKDLRPFFLKGEKLKVVDIRGSAITFIASNRPRVVMLEHWLTDFVKPEIVASKGHPLTRIFT